MGAAIVKRLAGEGATVVFTYVKGATQAAALVMALTEKGQHATAIAADSADARAVIAAVDQTVENFGRIDILVNNAGIYIGKPLADYTLQDVDNTMAINVRAVFLASQTAARYMKNGARIITVGSNMADRVAYANGSLYAMSKSALVGLTKGLARDLGAQGITVNLVQPGPVDTDMNPANSAHADVLRSAMAIPKYGAPDDIASLGRDLRPA